MTKEIQWEQFGMEYYKIKEIIENMPEISNWKIQYNEITLELRYNQIEHTFFKKIQEYFPQYELNVRQSNAYIIIPIITSHTNHEKREKKKE